ncbi:ATP-binding protein [[Pseudomonas] carboxydohydrogena]|uniref:histidine kinase n=1 Tax=Afipia carboxydohydrogena TaxID=290 RepID=A0ABY8BMW7_AFICR|nr:ATP-binding protein [[Pseudomonas] carboxydohydrogena]WEF51322.1 ATP-binding protein [[Pseudomonas] carboxydohydrogena]
MKLTTSLRGRLFAGLAVFVVGTALVAGYLAYRWAFDEAIELQDAILLQVGSLAANNRLEGRLPSEGNIDGEAELLIQDLQPRGATGDSVSMRRDLPGDLSDGLQTIAWNGEQWRILVRTRSDGSRVAVGQPTANRDEVAQDSALRTIVPLGVLIPCLMVVIAIVVDRSLRPLSSLARDIDAKQSDHLEKLPVEGIPAEILPFVASINRLLERIGAMFDRERRFVADAAHELRTPITALIVQADNLERVALSEDGRDRLQSLKTGTRRTAHLLEQLLTLARYDSEAATDPSSSEFDRIVKEVVADLLPIARKKSIDLGFIRAEAVSVHAESVALGVLARNLIDNALRHAPAGGRVDVSLFAENDHVVFQVDDTGPGIPEADLDRIFEPFFRGSRARGDGTGLGLSIVRRIVERCRGAIRLENKPLSEGAGLRVRVTIPSSKPR